MTNSLRQSRPHVVVSLVILALSGGCGGSTALLSAPLIPAAAAVSVAPQAIRLAPGGSARLEADVLDARGARMDNSSVVWTSSQPAVATVASDGVIRALAAGGTTITASAQGKSASAMVSVDATYDLAPRISRVVAVPTH